MTVRSATELFRCVRRTTFRGDIFLRRSFQSVQIGFDGRVFFVGLRSIASHSHFYAEEEGFVDEEEKRFERTNQCDLWSCYNP